MGFISSLSDPYVWVKASTERDKNWYYIYILVYVDDIIIVEKTMASSFLY